MITRSLSDQFADIRTEADIRYNLELAASRLGFGTYLLGFRKSGAKHWVDNYPQGDWLPPNAASRDPVAKKITLGTGSFLWGRETYEQQGGLDIWTAANEHGLNAGVVSSFRFGQGHNFFISLTSNSTLNDRHRKMYVEEVELLAGMLLGVATSNFLLADKLRKTLTQRQKELLKWTFSGYTSWEIAHRLSLSWVIVETELDTASKHIGVTSPLAAAFTAARLGILGAI